MAVDRISKLNIDERPMFTGIYGKSSLGESFIEKNLVMYHLWQELYLYLHEKGYTTIFYNKAYNFFSYQEQDLETFLCKVTPNSQPTSATPASTTLSGNSSSRHSRCRGPLGAVRQRQGGDSQSQAGQPQQSPNESATSRPVIAANTNPNTGLASHWPDIITGGSKQEGYFYQVKELQDNRVFDWIYNFTEKRPNEKLAVVFTTPEKTSLGNDLDRIREITKLKGKSLGHDRTDMPLRLLCLYSAETTSALHEMFSKERGFFFDTVFKNLIFPEVSNEGAMNFTDSYLFHVGNPSIDEIGNVLNRRRIMEGMQNVFNMPFDDTVRNLWQEFPWLDENGNAINDSVTKKPKQITTIDEMMNLKKETFELTLSKLTNEKAMDRLRKLMGMEGIIAQFERYLADLRACRESGEKFRPHMVFMGNPGTGKTTVARIFADVLREEGLLENGRLHQVTVGDLVAGYVGQTRIKTLEVCQKASGGVLFIDEAYGLYQSGSADTGGGSGGNSFGQEAIEVLLQFMENDTKSLVIMAGYPKEMEDLLKNGNAGFNSRIGEQGHFMFEDYKPETLTAIALSKIKDNGYTPEFERNLHAIFSMLYRFRDKDWANARTAENTISSIKSNYRSQGLEGAYDTNAIPDDLMRLIRILSPEEETGLMSDLNEMVGLRKVKASLSDIMSSAKANRIRLEELGKTDQKLPDLTFIFEGHPGTGKTTVARMMGRILAGYGLIKSPEVMEYSKTKLTSPVQGGSVKLVNEMFDNCIGRVLFIDEAYSLAEQDATDIVTQIVQCMTLPKYQGKMAIVMAGYPGDMERLINVNVGFKRRFTYRLEFEDYTNEELSTIYHNFIDKSGFLLADGCDPLILGWFKSQKRDANFGNAGLVKILHTEVEANNGRRIAVRGMERDFYRTYTPEDFPQTTAALTKSDDEILAELNALVGLRKVKDTIRGLINTIKVEKMRIDAGQQDDYSEKRLNFVFKGNPGTGKTTVARLLGNILANYGMISDPEVLTYKKADLVEGVVGASSKNVEKMFQAGVGKVIFIDEAYQLADHESKDALDAITNNMTDERYMNKMAMILAGYPGDMAQLIEGNPGLKSKFNYHIVFEDYSNEELWQIFCNKVRDARFTLSEECYPYAMAYFASINTGKKDFGNARETVSLLETVKARQGNRIMGLMNSEANVQDMLSMFTPEDFPTFGKINPAKFQPQTGAKQTGMDKLNALIGIDGIREQFRSYIAMLRHLRENPQSEVKFRPHMAFLGNPGTGKTTVARIFGQILREEGLLPNSNFVAVSSSDLIGEYIGQSAVKARGQFERARGGVLFVDEAYQLLRKDQGRAGTYGEEVVTELIQFMENDAESIVILAGYSNEILWLINNGNPGLKSRVPESNYFNFEDYSAETLYHIFIKKLSEYELTEDLKQTTQKILTAMHANRPANWGNARVAEEFSSEVFRNYLTKHNGEGPIDVDCISDRYMAYAVADAVRQMNSNQNGTSMQTQSPVPSENAITVDLSVNASSQHVSNVRQLEMATGLLKVHTSAGEGEGTGFIIQLENRYLLTCSHVIEGASSIIFSMQQGAFETKARVLWHDVRKDLALLQVDSLPDEVYFFELDSNIDSDPLKLTPLILCGYPDGTAFASGVSLIEGAINNYEKQRQWNDRQFDTIYANVSATHGCSGGPVVRKEDFVVVGLLQGGKEGGEIQFITDIHQLFRHINIKK